jgi:hypothetical protein
MEGRNNNNDVWKKRLLSFLDFIDTYCSEGRQTPVLCRGCYESANVCDDTAGLAFEEWGESKCGHFSICGRCMEEDEHNEIDFECSVCEMIKQQADENKRRDEESRKWQEDYRTRFPFPPRKKLNKDVTEDNVHPYFKSFIHQEDSTA